MSTIIQFLLKALVILFVLPALGLIAFHGGFGYALGTALLITVIGITLALVTFPLLAVGAFASAALGGRLGLFILGVFLLTGTLWVVSLFMHGLILTGFWHTVGAAAILSLIGSVFSRRSR
ncbi:MAG TPA: hypothetical protein V6C81_10820 [Planktothrix sp.]|jgi:hypothetical protein